MKNKNILKKIFSILEILDFYASWVTKVGVRACSLMVCCAHNDVLPEQELHSFSTESYVSSQENDLVHCNIADPFITFYVKSLVEIFLRADCSHDHGMAFQSSKVKADLKKLVPAADRPRIFMSNKTSKVVVVFPNGDVVEGRLLYTCFVCAPE